MSVHANFAELPSTPLASLGSPIDGPCQYAVELDAAGVVKGVWE